LFLLRGFFVGFFVFIASQRVYQENQRELGIIQDDFKETIGKLGWKSVLEVGAHWVGGDGLVVLGKSKNLVN
jgi:hypothetical protein